MKESFSRWNIKTESAKIIPRDDTAALSTRATLYNISEETIISSTSEENKLNGNRVQKDKMQRKASTTASLKIKERTENNSEEE